MPHPGVNHLSPMGNVPKAFPAGAEEVRFRFFIKLLWQPEHDVGLMPKAQSLGPELRHRD